MADSAERDMVTVTPARFEALIADLVQTLKERARPRGLLKPVPGGAAA